MAGVVAELDLTFAIPKIDALERVLVDGMLDSIGELVAGSVKERIETGKQSPDGVRWPSWSDVYAQSRHKGQSLLLVDGHLQGSIATYRRGNEVAVGSNLEYAAIHQFGGDTSRGHPPIPARPYLGLSIEDRRAIEDLISDVVERALQ